MKIKKISIVIVPLAIFIFTLIFFGFLISNNKYLKINIPYNGSTLDHRGYVILDENILKYKKTKRKLNLFNRYSKNILYYFEGVSEGKTELWVVNLFPGRIDFITKYEISVDSNLKAKVVSSPESDRVYIKCGVIKVDVKNTQINIEDNTIAGKVVVKNWPSTLNIMGLKEGSTTMTVKEKDGVEKKYSITVDSDLNLELNEI